jgi:hypothetical protein
MKKLLLTALIVVASAASANDLVLTSAAGKAGSITSIDLSSSGTATMLQFNIDVGAADAKALDLSACLAALPKTHKGECTFNGTEVVGLVYNDEGVALPKGVVNIGRITVNGNSELTVKQFLAADKNNNHVEGTSKVAK